MFNLLIFGDVGTGTIILLQRTEGYPKGIPSGKKEHMMVLAQPGREGMPLALPRASVAQRGDDPFSCAPSQSRVARKIVGKEPQGKAKRGIKPTEKGFTPSF